MSLTRGLLLDTNCPVEWSHPLNRGLVGMWAVPPNPGWSRGLTLRDLVRGGKKPNDGTLTNGPTWAPGPVPGVQALKFDGSDDYVSMPLVSSATNNFWLAAWIKAAAGQNKTSVTFNGNSGSNGWGFWFESSALNVIADGNSFTSVSPGYTNPNQVWFYASFSRNNGSNSLWVNGVLVGTGTQAFNTPTVAGSVGARIGGGNPAVCQVAGYAVGGRGLTAADHVALYDQARHGYPDTLRWLRPWSFGVDVGGGGDATGTLAVTLDALTSTAAGTVAVTGTASPTLAAITSTAAGTVAVTGTASPTLAAITSTAAGTVAVVGTLSATLGTLTSTAAGAVAVAGSTSQTLGTLTSTAAGTVAVTGTLSTTLDAATLAATGTVTSGPTGSLAVTLDAATLTAAGTVAVAGSAAVTLDALTSAAAGAVAVTGSTSATLAALTLTSAGTVGAAPPPVVIPGGTFRRPLPSWVRRFPRPVPSWSRVWKLPMPNVSIEPATRTKAASDDRDYLFDFSTAPEIVGGDTIASATITGGTGLTIGTAAPTEAEADHIAAGEAVQVQISGGEANTVYDLACVATLASGRVLVVPARLAVAANYG